MSRTRLCAPSQPTRYRAVTRYCPSDPHEPPDQVNDRARDLVDLLLIRETFYRDGTDLAALRAACVDVFAARAADAQSLGLPVRTWPPTLHAHDHWQTDFTAANADVDLTLETAVDLVTSWIQQIDAAPTA